MLIFSPQIYSEADGVDFNPLKINISPIFLYNHGQNQM